MSGNSVAACQKCVASEHHRVAFQTHRLRQLWDKQVSAVPSVWATRCSAKLVLSAWYSSVLLVFSGHASPRRARALANALSSQVGLQQEALKTSGQKAFAKQRCNEIGSSTEVYYLGCFLNCHFHLVFVDLLGVESIVFTFLLYGIF